MNIYLDYVIKLIRCVLKDEPAPVVPKGMDFNRLFDIAKFHSIEPILYKALEKSNISENKIAKFKEKYAFSVIFEAKRDFCIKKLSEEFEKHQIKNCLLKGGVLRSLYPEPNLRSSCDIDIFVGDSLSACRPIMDELGFACNKEDSELLIHDEYKKDIIMVELHRALMPEYPPFKGVEICKDIEKRLVIADGKSYTYELSPEDFYLFMLIHLAKHVKHNGMGIKGYIDIRLFLEKYGDTLNWDKINTELKKCDLFGFNKNVLDLANYWFGDGNESELISQFAQLTFSSGKMGITSIVASEELYLNKRDKNAFKYYIEIIFLPLKFMRDKYKILRKLPFLLPVFWIYRIICVLLFKSKNISTVTEHYAKANAKYGEQIHKLKKSLGLL